MSADAPKIKDGDFVVSRTRWSVEVAQVTKVSPSLVFYQDKSWNPPRTRRIRIADVLFAGAKDAAEKLAAQLTSSRELCEQERRDATARQITRDQTYLAAVRGRGE